MAEPQTREDADSGESKETLIQQILGDLAKKPIKGLQVLHIGDSSSDFVIVPPDGPFNRGVMVTFKDNKHVVIEIPSNGTKMEIPNTWAMSVIHLKIERILNAMYPYITFLSKVAKDLRQWDAALLKNWLVVLELTEPWSKIFEEKKIDAEVFLTHCGKGDPRMNSFFEYLGEPTTWTEEQQEQLEVAINNLIYYYYPKGIPVKDR